MSETDFIELGKMEAISRLYEGTPFTPFITSCLETAGPKYLYSASRTFLEGIDFDLVYFPLKHLGYKSVTAITGELYASLSNPATLDIVLGISAKLDFAYIDELWKGMARAAVEHGFKQVSLDLVPSRNGLVISVSGTGLRSLPTGKRRPQAKSKDLICVSGSLGAAYIGQQLLEKEKKSFENNVFEHPDLDKYKMLVGAYLKPELDSGIPAAFEEAEVNPPFGYFIKNGLADTVMRLARHSKLGAKIYADKIPFEGNSFQLGKELDIDPVSAAMNGGDDYKLLYVIPILSLEKFRRNFPSFDIIGHLALPEAGTVLVTPDGAELPLKAQGWKTSV